jgi:hypothetical protein
MAVYYFGACDETAIPDHICDPCEAQEKGRVSSVAFIQKNFVFSDPSNPAEWVAGINSRQIFVIPTVTGSFDGGTAVTGSGYGRQATKFLGFDFTMNFRDPNYTQNPDFYFSPHISDNPVSVVPKNPVTEEINSDVVWDVDVAWNQDGVVRPYPQPANIIDECYNVI